MLASKGVRRHILLHFHRVHSPAAGLPRTRGRYLLPLHRICEAFEDGQIRGTRLASRMAGGLDRRRGGIDMSASSLLVSPSLPSYSIILD